MQARADSTAAGSARLQRDDGPDNVTTPAELPPNVLPIELLEREMVTLNTRMVADEYGLLALIREFDERGGWLKWGSTNCAEWLHWRLDLSLSAAREKVRVAHALKSLPEISNAFRRGALSYSKVRALTRVANRANELDLLAFAMTVSAALVEQHCQQLRNVRPDATEVARRAHQNRYLSASRNRSRSTMTITMEVPLEEGEMVLNTLDRVLSEQPDAADASHSYRVRQADALLDLCRDRLAGRVSTGDEDALRGGIAESGDAIARPRSGADLYQVMVHVDRSALDDDPKPDARSDLPAETVRRLTCDGALVPIQSDGNGIPTHIGRKQRTVSTSLKRALLARDRQCRFPGCAHTRFVDAHHVQHWAHGGETTLDNLMLLCDHHHRLVHEGGFSIFVDHEGNRCFRRPDGRAVPACGYRREDQVDDDGPSAEVCENSGVRAAE